MENARSASFPADRNNGQDGNGASSSATTLHRLDGKKDDATDCVNAAGATRQDAVSPQHPQARSNTDWLSKSGFGDVTAVKEKPREGMRGIKSSGILNSFLLDAEQTVRGLEVGNDRRARKNTTGVAVKQVMIHESKDERDSPRPTEALSDVDVETSEGRPDSPQTATTLTPVTQQTRTLARSASPSYRAPAARSPSPPPFSDARRSVMLTSKVETEGVVDDVSHPLSALHGPVVPPRMQSRAKSVSRLGPA